LPAADQHHQHHGDEVSEQLVVALATIESVKVAELDAQHSECVELLAALAERRSVEALAGFVAVFEHHCAHEEALLNLHLYAPEEARVASAEATTASLLLDSRNSHFQDHLRIIRGAKVELARLRAMPGESCGPVHPSAESTVLSRPVEADHQHSGDDSQQRERRGSGEGSGDRKAPLRQVPGALVNALLRDFEAHANLYDASYADGLAAAIAS
jgi:hypothetical protein